MDSIENKFELKGKVVRWVATHNWGVINFYPEGGTNDAPRKAFLHISKVISDVKPQMGSRVIFDLGPARSATELPAALRCRVITSSEVL